MQTPLANTVLPEYSRIPWMSANTMAHCMRMQPLVVHSSWALGKEFGRFVKVRVLAFQPSEKD